MLDRVPNQSFTHGFILMPIDIPGGGDSRPVDLRMPQEQVLREPPRCFRDNLQCANYRVNRLAVGAKAWKSSPVVKARTASTLSMMSDAEPDS